MGCASSIEIKKTATRRQSSVIQVPFENSEFRLYQLDASSPCWFYEHISTGETLVIDPYQEVERSTEGSCFNNAAIIYAEPTAIPREDDVTDTPIGEEANQTITGIVITRQFKDCSYQIMREYFEKDIPIYCGNISCEDVKNGFPQQRIITRLSNKSNTRVGKAWSLLLISSPRNTLSQAQCGVLFTALPSIKKRLKESWVSSVLHVPNGLQPTAEQINLIRSRSSKCLVLLSKTEMHTLSFFWGRVSTIQKETKQLMHQLNIVTDYLVVQSPSPPMQKNSLLSQFVRYFAKNPRPAGTNSR